MLKRILVTSLLLSFSHHAIGETNYVVRRDAVFLEQDNMPDGLKVFWWNLGCSATKDLDKINERIREDFHPRNQYANLRKLLGDENLSPDVLILGEYCPKFFTDDSLEKELKIFYPYSFHKEKPNSTYNVRNGILFLSKYEISLLRDEVLEPGNFLEQDYMKTCEEEQGSRFFEEAFNSEHWKRPLLEFEVLKNGKSYKVVPVHLSNPWKQIHICSGGNKLSTGLEIAFGVDNPNYVQSLKLSEEYKDTTSTILIGDFNAPKVIKGLSSNSYKNLRRALGNSAVLSEEATYFDVSGSFGSYSLDHAFVSSDLKVKKEMVLPFSGSDHAPIYIIIE